MACPSCRPWSVDGGPEEANGVIDPPDDSDDEGTESYELDDHYPLEDGGEDEDDED